MFLFKILFLFTPLFVFSNTIDPPVFSHNSGYYKSKFSLKLSHSNSSAKIIYTIDGSIPDINNLSGKTYEFKKGYAQFKNQSPSDFKLFKNNLLSYSYTNQILITDKSNQPNRIAEIPTSFHAQPYIPATNLDKGFVVRAKAYFNDEESEVVSQIYFINKQVSQLPVFAINIDEDKLFDYEKGLFVSGKTFDDWRINNPDKDAFMWSFGNYWESGLASEVMANAIFLENGNEKLNQNIGIRNNGTGTRLASNRSIRVYAKAKYGKKTLEHNFFGDTNFMDFKRLILRNSGQDSNKTLFRDAFIHTLNSDLNVQTQKYLPSNVYVNGEYFGIYNIRDRYDEKYFKRVFDINDDEIDFLENDGTVIIGDDIFYKEMISFFENTDLSISSNYEKALNYIDPTNFIDYYVAQIFAANYDWPQGNNVFFRKKTNINLNEKFAHDGKFRWLLKDLDIAFNGDPNWISDSFNYNTLEHALKNDFYRPFVNPVFSGLLKNQTFKNNFINRFADLLNTIYTPNYSINLINQMQNVLKPEINKHIVRWKIIESEQAWNENVDKMRQFAQLRPAIQKQHLINFFNLEGIMELKLKVSDSKQGLVKINSINISSETKGIDKTKTEWKGEYFKNVPLKIKAIPATGYKFSHWVGLKDATSEEIEIIPTENIDIQAIFVKL